MAKRRAARRTEALPGGRTFAELQTLIGEALEADLGASWCWVRDITDEWVAYDVEGNIDGEWTCDTFRRPYTVADDGTVTFGDPVDVEVRTVYEPEPGEAARATEGRVLRTRIQGRVLESRADAADGGRVFACQIIEVGDSDNGVRYTESVLRSGATLYEGAKAFDHHRTEAELASSSIVGIVGQWRNVEAQRDGLYGDLVLLPSAVHTAEALDASLAAQAAGLPPVVGISHDVRMYATPVLEGGRRIQEATAIERVLSADVVADPSAGGRATRVVAGGIGSVTPNAQEGTMTIKELLDALREATADERAALLTEHAAVLEASGWTEADIPTLLGEASSTESASATDTAAGADSTVEAEGDLVAVTESRGGAVRALSVEREGALGGMLIREAVAHTSDPSAWEGILRNRLPERFTEAQLKREVESLQGTAEALEKAGMSSRISVHKEDKDKGRDGLAAAFAGDHRNGFVRISEAVAAINGEPWQPMDIDRAGDLIEAMWKGCSAKSVARRQKESIESGTFDQALADVLNRQLLTWYGSSSIGWWRDIVKVRPLVDFRSGKLVRIGGYGTLPKVLESGTYQALTSPTDEQATISLQKMGGTEDWTLETLVNDDLSVLTGTPMRMADAAQQTLYREFVGPATGDATGYLTASPSIYDSVALFHSSHANTTAGTTLGDAGMIILRQKMRDQAQYGNSVNVMGLTPKFLLVPNELESVGNALCSGTWGVPSTTPGATNVPNLFTGMQLRVVDSWTDANDYIAIADPNLYPGLTVGFLNGKEDPELFANDDPTQGAVFSRDVFTLKVRHIWASTVEDYRPLQRMTN